MHNAFRSIWVYVTSNCAEIQRFALGNFFKLKDALTFHMMEIRLLKPRSSSKVVRVSQNMQISKIQAMFGSKNMLLLCHGQILSPTKTLAFYNIGECSTIIGIEDGERSELGYWFKSTTDHDYFNNMMKLVASKDPKARQMVLHRYDVIAKRMEMKPKTMRRVMEQYNRLDIQKKNSRPVDPLVIPSPADEISDQPLPIPIGW